MLTTSDYDALRRCDISRHTEAERLIHEAMGAVERLPGDVRLTDAVSLLFAAKNRVADFVDEIPGLRTFPRQDIAASEPDDGWSWAIIEVMGHRRHVGRVREEQRYGVAMVRVDVPIDGDPEAKGWLTHFYPGSALFGETPCTREAAMKANKPHEPPARLALSRSRDDWDDDRPF